MIKFEVISEYEVKGINLPKRGTKGSAGYDIEAACDIVVPSIFSQMKNVTIEDVKVMQISGFSRFPSFTDTPYYSTNNRQVEDIESIKEIVKSNNLRTMIPTGIKAKMPENVVLKIYPRSGTGSNCLLVLANQTGIIDSDYYNNPKNEGHIFIPMINLSPYDIEIKKGERIAQGIFEPYLVTDDDSAEEERTGGFGSTDK